VRIDAMAAMRQIHGFLQQTGDDVRSPAVSSGADRGAPVIFARFGAVIHFHHDIFEVFECQSAVH
jgi:hypothetical protein